MVTRYLISYVCDLSNMNDFDPNSIRSAYFGPIFLHKESITLNTPAEKCVSTLMISFPNRFDIWVEMKPIFGRKIESVSFYCNQTQ